MQIGDFEVKISLSTKNIGYRTLFRILTFLRERITSSATCQDSIFANEVNFRKKLFQEAESGGDNFNSSFADFFQNSDYLNAEDAGNAAEVLMHWISLLPTVAAFGLFWLERMILTVLHIMYKDIIMYCSCI